ncbi:MAG: MFS transporter [Flavobacterium sp. BFFFF2]|nr:MAG: MFS transporter [Flavobacterium sp. BFFFF2]
MKRNLLHKYVDQFRGFSREIWILTFITFINRAGTMVVPFLSKYMKEGLHFTYGQVGWVLFCFGLGSMAGSWLGGKFSDTIGFYKIMIFSLFTSGLLLLMLQFITGFYPLCAAVFVTMVVADMFRPAMFVSIGAYAKPENRTRALTLVRLAINLGFAAGPALGGLIIMSIGYRGLFWADGATCLAAIIVFWIMVKEKKKSVYKDTIEPGQMVTRSVFKDRPFWVFLTVCMITGILFFQLFTTIPLYHRIQFGLTELQTGLLLTFNGLMVFFLEMPLVGYMEKHKVHKAYIVAWGCLLMSLSIFSLLIKSWAGILIPMMVLMTFAEMFAFPFSNSFSLGRAPKGQEGRYMALYTMSYSLAHIVGAKLGMFTVDTLGYDANWIVMGTLGLVGFGLCLWVWKATAS